MNFLLKNHFKDFFQEIDQSIGNHSECQTVSIQIRPGNLFATLGDQQNGKNLSIAGKELRICPSIGMCSDGYE